jgi:hypothetical protein
LKDSAISEESTHETNAPINENQLREYAMSSISKFKSTQSTTTMTQENGRHIREVKKSEF